MKLVRGQLQHLHSLDVSATVWSLQPLSEWGTRCHAACRPNPAPNYHPDWRRSGWRSSRPAATLATTPRCPTCSTSVTGRSPTVGVLAGSFRVRITHDWASPGFDSQQKSVWSFSKWAMTSPSQNTKSAPKNAIDFKVIGNIQNNRLHNKPSSDHL